MFHLFSHCCSWLQAAQEPVRKVTLLVVGLDNAGKTTLVMDLQRVLAGEVLPAAKPGQTHLQVDRFEVTLVDLPGGQRSRSAWRSHYGAAHGLLFVLDASDPARMEEARKALARVLSHPKVSGKPVLLLANKQDAADALLPCELVECLCLEQLVNANKSLCRIEPCAAAVGLQRGPCRSILLGLRWLLRAIAADYDALSARVLQPSPAAPRGAERPPGRAHREPPARREDAHEGDGEAGAHRPLQPIHNLLPQEESAKSAGRRKRKVKVRKKGLGPAGSPAEEPEGPGGGGDGRAGAGAGLLPTNRVGQEDLAPAGTATPQAGQGMKRKKKKKIQNKIKSQESALEQQHEAVSSTFDLYRRAMLALKMRQEQRKQLAAIAP
ncbi:ADP-ribosylation factor-like protein 13A [Apteryx mantelli]|uniref:ADP-ribosylation factor-like protein 13A n=1 Tax=Apteryx mantelli TaxID=2696672 RepID=A0ABM4F6C0_9AVES